MTNDPILPQPAQRESVTIRTLVVFMLMWMGVAINVGLSANLLPKTIERVNDDPRIIGLILALNPLFGFIAQPLVGILSDRIWTPIGRRAFFIITSSPIISIALWFIPEVALLWQLFIAVLFFEFFMDVVIGSDHPLIADLVPPKQRLFVNGMIITIMTLTSAVLLRFGMGHLLKHYDHQVLYRIGAVAQIVLIMIPAFFLQEKPVEKDLSRPKLTLKRYVMDVWGHRELRRLSIIFLIGAIFDTLIKTYMVLFATRSLGATTSEFGNYWYLMPLMGLFAIPGGISIEKWIPKDKALLLAFLLEICACVFAIFGDEPSDLILVALLFGLGFTIKGVIVKPFFTEFIPKDLIGQVSGAMNLFHAAGKTLATFGGGYLVFFANNDYRVLFYYALAIGIGAALLCLRVTDHRFKQRKTGS